MPRAVTSGLWREVRLEVRDPIYFSQMHFCANSKRCDFLYELACKWSDLENVEIELDNWHVSFRVCYDTLAEEAGRCAVIDGATDEVLPECGFNAAPNTTTVIGKLPVYYSDHKYLLIRWEQDGKAFFNHYICGYPPLDLDTYKAFMKKYGL